ncbi:MAG: TetR/AcrR family transcriptional regulator [Rhizobiaceae bacterium]|jgi:AcrR family transcriptional regulator|nr:TetR/AcrR family transcriptional regulator [Rhizobiaceae bacterium]
MKLTQSRSQKSRETILAAARALFDEKGYAAAAMDEVAQRAGLSKASIFAHFTDKQAVLATLGIADIELLLRELRPRAAAGIALSAEALAETFSPWLRYFLAKPDFARLYLIQSGLLRSPESQAYVALCASHEALIAEGLARGNSGLPMPAANQIARGAQAHFQQVLVYRLSGWIVSDAEAEQSLQDALAIWCTGADKLFTPPSGPA